MAVGVREDAVRRHRRRRRAIRAWFWDFDGRGPDPIHRCSRQTSRQRRDAVHPGAAGSRHLALRRARVDAVVETAAPDPWSLPVRAIASLYTHHAMDQVDRRVRLRGTVTATRVGQPTLVEDITMHSRSRDVRHKVYVRDESSAALIETEQSFELAPGDVDRSRRIPDRQLDQAANSECRHPPGWDAHGVPAPVALSLETLPGDDHDSELVQSRRPVSSPMWPRRLDDRWSSRLATACSRRTTIRCPARRPRPTPVAASVSVTGVYAFESGPPPTFRMLLRSAGDVVLLAAAPWWTYRHTLVLLPGDGGDGIIGLVWVRMIANRNALAAGAISRDHRRAKPSRERASRHARAGAGGHSAAARRGGAERWTLRRRPRAAHLASPRKCCVTVSAKRVDRSWICGTARSRRAISSGALSERRASR